MNKNLDKSNLRQVIIDYPNQLAIGKKFAENINLKLDKKPSNLIICGMGGSALPGDVLIAHLKNQGIKLPIYLAMDYSLPHETNEDSLIFISSYSGNTEETVACFEEALEKNLNIIAFSESGKVEEIAQKNNVPHVKYQIDFPNFQPR